MKAWLEISDLQKKIDDDFQLGPIDLRIVPGTITALVGNNGSGKSTLLKLIMNLANPDVGNIKVFGKFVYGQDESWKNQISYLPQTRIGWDAYSGNTLKRLIAPIYPNWDDALFIQIVELFNIPLNKPYRKLSQGIQQKLSLALTIPRNTPLLLLDEPTSFMDMPSKKQFVDLVVDWMDQDERAIIIASHQAEDIRKLSDYLCVIQNGKHVGTFEKETLTEHYMRYWIHGAFPEQRIPGEVTREKHQLISNDPAATENFLLKNNVTWTDRSKLDLEDIVSHLLNAGKEG
ncbi:ATP-binding cassette domain-containing protein [Virgibacillus oceani]|uniref:ABC transporter ATP-binding protein n=1 Tax=Virgibacillus oceani TaxID=1479511 RepID=A0A917H977_9BACI|nr:ABC transporter ATP-binding protein [Virgibacillus oceani]GGG71581.1 ABC transporter ATP-binding protein [Virgibacillus oceani]